MSAIGLSSRSVSTVRQMVYVRRHAALQPKTPPAPPPAAPPAPVPMPINGETTGWVLDRNLLCNSISLREGAAGGVASLAYVPSTATEFRIQHALGYYGGDDQVRVCAMPADDPLIEQPKKPADMPILFEGLLGIAEAQIVISDQAADEQVTFTAQHMPRLDNSLTEHLITGRWMFDRKAETQANGEKPFIAFTPDLPAMFNFHGCRNQSKQRVGLTIGAGDSAKKLRGPVFTHDDDPDGRFWTVRSALASLIAFWLYGPTHRYDGTDEFEITGMTRNRSTCVEAALLTELLKADDAKGEGAFAAMGLQLPECNVTGMHVLSAIERVCEMAGCRMALECVPTPTLGGESAPAGQDRRYQLRIWQAGRGTMKEFYLGKSGATYAKPEHFFKANNLREFSLLRDTQSIVNEIVSTGDSFVEGAIVLKPSWAPGDMDAAVVDQTFQSVDDNKKAGSGYWAKHCERGRLFEQYGHVGRLWIVDCVGDPFGKAGTNIAGYPTGLYNQEDQGFDFCEALGLQATGNRIEQERASLGLANPMMRWSNRPRRALPLRNSASQAKADDYVLEVSEDGGTSWQRCTAPRKSTREYFGILLNIENLAVVNNKSFGAGGRPSSWRNSWWQLIKQELLLFRLTCTVRSDSGAVVMLPRNGTSGSGYKTGQLMVQRGIEEVWQAPGSPVNPGFGTQGGTHRKVMGFGVATTPLATHDLHTWTNQLRDAAALRQASLEQRRLSARASLYLFTFGQYALGDCITMIRGRDISLGTNAGKAATYPNIVGIDLVLAPGKSQGVLIAMEDHALGSDV